MRKQLGLSIVCIGVSPPSLSKTPPPSFLPNFLPKILKFSSLNPFYLLKVTKFLLKFSQFEFLVMIEKNIFVYKLFLSLNTSTEKSYSPPPFFSSNPLSKLRSCQAPLFENLVGGSTSLHPYKGGRWGGVYTMLSNWTKSVNSGISLNQKLMSFEMTSFQKNWVECHYGKWKVTCHLIRFFNMLYAGKVSYTGDNGHHRKYLGRW